MKYSILFILCLCTFAGMQAQGIRTGSKWNVGSMDYTAKVNSDRTITFSATAEGEELAFRLTPTPGKTDEYTIGTDPNSDGTNPFEKSTRAKYINQQGWRLLCLYDSNGYLLNILDATQSVDGEKVAVGKWMEQISGKYLDHYGDTLQIGHETIYERGVARATYENITFNGGITGVVKISGLTNLEGTWEIVQTLNGLTLYQVEQDEYGMFTRKGEKENLTWVNSEPRFGYANRILLNDRVFSTLKKSTLRIMRNSILAVHSYMVSSPDLVEYFGNQPWFSPRPSNDDVYDELSLVERLNIELIKAEENNPRHDEYIKEP